MIRCGGTLGLYLILTSWVGRKLTSCVGSDGDMKADIPVNIVLWMSKVFQLSPQFLYNSW